MPFKRFILFIIIPVVISFSSCDNEKEDPELIEDFFPELQCIPNNLHENVLAYYSFSSGKVFDYSGNGHNLSSATTALPTDDRNGNTKSAFAFNKSDAILLTDTEFLNIDQLSISMWYFSTDDETREGGDFETLIARGVNDSDGCDGDEPWSLALYDCKREVFAATGSIWGQLVSEGEFSCDGEMAARSGSWHHLVATINATTKEMKLYRDGVLQDETTEVSGCREWVDLGSLILGDGFNGKLDDIALFDKVLTSEEVKGLFDMIACF